MLEDGARDVDARVLAVFGWCAVADDGGAELWERELRGEWRGGGRIGGCVGEDDEAAFGLELVEDQFEDGGEEGVAVGEGGGEGGELVDELELVECGRARLGLGHDDAVVVAGEGSLDLGVDLVGLEDADEVEVFALVERLAAAEDEEGASAADLIARSESGALADGDAVDVGSVLRVEVADEPLAAVGGEFGVPARDGVVGEGQGLAGAADELRLIGGELEGAALVGALDDGEEEHGEG